MFQMLGTIFTYKDERDTVPLGVLCEAGKVF